MFLHWSVQFYSHNLRTQNVYRVHLQSGHRVCNFRPPVALVGILDWHLKHVDARR